jgi:hypothetical protein
MLGSLYTIAQGAISPEPILNMHATIASGSTCSEVGPTQLRRGGGAAERRAASGAGSGGGGRGVRAHEEDVARPRDNQSPPQSTKPRSGSDRILRDRGRGGDEEWGC